MPRRLVCVVEGHGEVAAIPKLCARVLYAHLEVDRSAWTVDPDPIRRPKGRLVDERGPTGQRPPHLDGLSKAIRLVRARGAHAALVLVDADADCPAAWGPGARAGIREQTAGAAIMVVREYEAWLLAGHAEVELPGDDAERVKNPKAQAMKTWPGYKPTTHQLDLTVSMDLALAIRRSRSFDYLVRSLRTLTA